MYPLDCCAKMHGSRNGASSLLYLSFIVFAITFFCPSIQSSAQEDNGPTINDYVPSGEPEVSREEWRQRVEGARRRAREVARERSEHPELYAPIQEDPDLVATERVLNDDSLQPGDIVTTKKGTFVYLGRPDQPRRDEDFVPIAPKPSR